MRWRVEMIKIEQSDPVGAECPSWEQADPDTKRRWRNIAGHHVVALGDLLPTAAENIKSVAQVDRDHVVTIWPARQRYTTDWRDVDPGPLA